MSDIFASVCHTITTDEDPEGKTPFAVARVDGDPVAFAGIRVDDDADEAEGIEPFQLGATARGALTG